MSVKYTEPGTGTEIAATTLSDSTRAQVFRLDVGAGTTISPFTGTVVLGAGSAAVGTVGVTGSVAVTGTFYPATQPVSIASAVAVTGTFWQATQPVSIASAIGVASPDNIATAQVSVGATATLIAALRSGRRSITIEQLGTTAVYIGGASVTTSNGILLPGTAGSSVTLNTTAAIFGITASGSQSVAEVETY